MTFKELKKLIEQAPNKTNNLYYLSYPLEDEIEIISSLYTYGIPCRNVKSVDDIYNVKDKEQLDPELFNNPFYLKVFLESFSENTIDIINHLDDNVFVYLGFESDFDSEKMQKLSKLTHANHVFFYNGWINLDVIYSLVNRFTFSEESSPTVLIDRIDSTTPEKIIGLCQKLNTSKFRIVINDAESLQNLNSIIPHIPNDEISIILDDNLFLEKNPKNARGLVIQNIPVQKPNNKKLKIEFRDAKYDSIEQIYELEKNIELIKSHIPLNANELDIVTFVTLFMINYFNYDYDRAKEEKNNYNFPEINMAQFLSGEKGVCRHFASFFEYVLNSLGVECEIVDAPENHPIDMYNDSRGHAFNIVKIKGKQYFIDVTWITELMRAGIINSLDESNDFLASNKLFGHDKYSDVISKYHCETYDRDEIKESVNRVINWNSNYIIHAQALRDLFKKHILKKEKSVADKINYAIPRRK